ncbi:hypothetical protein GFM13_10075 [Rhizobium leguminosarum bv. viciae]|nr:hypothetical protein [Rhizobium leguminosarum bv. viciae]
MIIEARFRPGFFLFAGVSIPAWQQCRNRSFPRKRRVTAPGSSLRWRGCGRRKTVRSKGGGLDVYEAERDVPESLRRMETVMDRL